MRRLWNLWKLGSRDLRVLWYALRHPNRPLWLIPVLGILCFYALEPFNFALPLLGVVDDLIILPLALTLLTKLLPAAIVADFGRTQGTPLK